MNDEPEIPPHDLAIERAVLGSLMHDDVAGVRDRVLATLRADQFFTDYHRAIYRAACRAHERGALDLVTLAHVLRDDRALDAVGGLAYLEQLFQEGAVAAHLPQYADTVRELAAKRDVLRVTREIAYASLNGARVDEILTTASEQLDAIRRGRAAGTVAFGVTGLGTFLALAELAADAEVYVEDVLGSDGGGFIAGEEKLGKTYYALDEALCLVLPRPVCGRFAVPRRRRVLFIEEEDPPRRTKNRVRALLRGHGLDPDNDELRADLNEWFRLEVWSGFTFDNSLMVEKLRAAIAAFRPAVCYVDVLRKVTRRDLNKTDQASALLAILDEIRREYGVVFRVLHHYRKAQGFRVGRGSQEIGGSFVLGAWGEASLFFEPIGRKQGDVRVSVQMKDGAPIPPFRLRIQSEGPRQAPEFVRLVALDDEPSGSDVDELVYEAIATLPKTEALAGKPGVLRTTVVAAVKKSDKTVRRALDRLTDAGRILVTGNATKRAALYAVNVQ